MQPLIEAKNLRCERDDRLLFDNLSFAVTPGEIWQVEGPNGAGKTTLLKILAGLMPVQEGDLLLQGQPMAAMQVQFLSDLLYLGHRPGVKSAFTPSENLFYWASPRFSVTSAEIDDALQQVGLEGYEDVPCHSLSAGQQRRVALARLHLSPASLWILDEAFTAIDKAGVEELENLMVLKARKGGAILLTTHHPLHLARTHTSFRSLQLGGRGWS